MSQIIEGIDNEVALIFFFLTVVIAIIVPLYLLRPALHQNYGESNQGPQGREPRDQLESTGLNSSSPIPVRTDPSRTGNVGIEDNTLSQRGSIYPGLETNRNDHEGVSRLQTVNASLNPDAHNQRAASQGAGSSTLSAAPVSPGIQGDAILPPEEVDLISIRVMHLETSRTFSVNRSLTLAEFKRLSFPAESAAGKLIRFVHHGRVLNGDSHPLQYIGVINNSVLHVSISDAPTAAPNVSSEADPAGLDLSELLVPLVVGCLAFFWGLLFLYGNMFSTSGIAILAFLSVLVAVMLYAR